MCTLIFDIQGGLTDQKRDIVSILHYCNNKDFKFSVRQGHCRNANDSTGFKYYDFKNLFNDDMFTCQPNYVLYDKIKPHMTTKNTLDMYTTKIKKHLWKDAEKKNLQNIMATLPEIISKNSKEYIIIGGSFWSYYNDPIWISGDIVDAEKSGIIKPSKKILDKYEEIKTRINVNEYNFIQYRYEKDWESHCKYKHIPFVKIPFDQLIEKIPFKKNLPVYVSASCVESLHENGYSTKKLSECPNIIYKYNSEVEGFNFDECGYIDCLFGMNAQEVYGFSVSGFSDFLNRYKKTDNAYDKIV